MPFSNDDNSIKGDDEPQGSDMVDSEGSDSDDSSSDDDASASTAASPNLDSLLQAINSQLTRLAQECDRVEASLTHSVDQHTDTKITALRQELRTLIAQEDQKLQVLFHQRLNQAIQEIEQKCINTTAKLNQEISKSYTDMINGLKIAETSLRDYVDKAINNERTNLRLQTLDQQRKDIASLKLSRDNATSARKTLRDRLKTVNDDLSKQREEITTLKQQQQKLTAQFEALSRRVEALSDIIVRDRVNTNRRLEALERAIRPTSQVQPVAAAVASSWAASSPGMFTLSLPPSATSAVPGAADPYLNPYL